MKYGSLGEKLFAEMMMTLATKAPNVLNFQAVKIPNN